MTVAFRLWRGRATLREIALAGVLAAPIAVAGCQGGGGDLDFARSGIGKDLYSQDLAVATANLETYFGFICKQSNLPISLGPNGYPECMYSSLGPDGWTLIVQTGFNDIDRRCDGYLQWLEEVRLRGELINAKLNDAGRLTNQILTAATPAAGVTIGIVSEAFGFARSAFANYQNRLLLGFEGSTIKTIVSERRLDFRQVYAGVRFQYKPDAVNALRTYLRICMPYTITMDANTFARTTSSGMALPHSMTAEAQVATVVGERSLRTASSVATANPQNTQLTITMQDPNVVALFGENSGRTVESVKAIQRRLCVTADGKVGPATRTAITDRRRALELRIVPGDDQVALRPGEDAAILTLPECEVGRYAHYYETTILAGQQQVASFVVLFNEAGAGNVSPLDNPTISSDKSSEFRVRVADMRRFLSSRHGFNESLPPELAHFITFALRSKMIEVANGGG